MQQGLVDHHEMGGKPIPASNLVNYKRTEPGEIVMNRMRAAAGLFAKTPKVGLVSPDYAVLRPHKTVELQYFVHLFRTPVMMAIFRVESRGLGTGESGFLRLYTERFGMLAVPVPPLAEQAAIVRFLNQADRRIRRYVHAKQRLIKLLEEQKQAIIHRALTQGLDPNARLKQSGVEWLGDIPEHWDVLRCRYIFHEIDQRSVDGSEQHLSMSQRLGLVPDHLVQNRTLVSATYAGGKLCNVGDLVMNRLKAHLGVFALARFHGVISPDYTVLRLADGRGAAFFEYVLRSPACRGELRMRAKGIVEGFWRLYTDDLYNIRVPVPPADEQLRIVAYIVDATSTIRATIERAETEIALLREYRTRLFADVVAGKRDVRVAAAALPNESADGGFIDDDDDLHGDDAEVGDETVESDDD